MTFRFVSEYQLIKINAINASEVLCLGFQSVVEGLMLNRFGTMDEELADTDQIHTSSYKTEPTGAD
jgi:hypothetical protein